MVMSAKNVLILGINGSIDIFNGIVGFAKEQGWNLMIEDPATLPGIPRCDGIIVTLLDLPDKLRITRRAIHDGIPVLDITDEIHMDGVSRVTVDFSAAGAMSARHFAERGFRRAAWFSMDSYAMHGLVKAGFGNVWRGDPVLDWTCLTRNGTKSLEDFLHTALTKARKPIAVLTFNTYNAYRLLNSCLTAGIQVPNEIAILSATNETPYLDSAHSKTISYVIFDYEELGRKAARELGRIMSGKPPSDTLRIAPTRICLGDSTDTYTIDDPRLRAALVYIHDHLGEPLNAETIAAHVGISRISLDRLFNSCSGHTTGREIRRQRMAAVHDLLTSTDMKLEAIAATTGTCHASYLIKTFAREYGMTPAKYRALHFRRRQRKT